MRFSAKELRAIGVYCRSRGARPELTIYSLVRATVLATGQTLEAGIDQVVDEYEATRKEGTK